MLFFEIKGKGMGRKPSVESIRKRFIPLTGDRDVYSVYIQLKEIGRAAIHPLAELIVGHETTHIKERTIDCLSYIGGDDSFAVIILATHDKDKFIRAYAGRAAIRTYKSLALPFILHLLSDATPVVINVRLCDMVAQEVRAHIGDYGEPTLRAHKL